MSQDPANSLNFKFNSFAFHIQKQLDLFIKKEFTISFSHFAALLAIQANPYTSQQKVAEYLVISRSTATHICRQLVKMGLIIIEHSDVSLREYKLSCTDKGNKLVSQSVDQVNNYFDSLLYMISSSDKAKLGEIIDAFFKVNSKVKFKK